MEGDLDLFFDAVATSQETEVATSSVVPLPQAIDEEVSGRNDGGANDLLNALNGVVDIDNDNEPAPENIPSPQDDASQHNSILSGDWGHDGIASDDNTEFASNDNSMFPIRKQGFTLIWMSIVEATSICSSLKVFFQQSTSNR